MNQEILAKDVKGGDAIFTTLKQRKPRLILKVLIFDKDSAPAKKGDVLLITHDCGELLLKPTDIVFKNNQKGVEHALKMLKKSKNRQ